MICLISGIISVLNFSSPVFVRLSIFSLGIASIFLITTLRSPAFLSAFAMWFFRAWLLPRYGMRDFNLFTFLAITLKAKYTLAQKMLGIVC